MFCTVCCDLDDAATLLRGRSYSLNPLRRTHLPETLVGATQCLPSVRGETLSCFHPLSDSPNGTTRLADPRSLTEIKRRPFFTHHLSKHSLILKRDEKSNAMPGRISTKSTIKTFSAVAPDIIREICIDDGGCSLWFPLLFKIEM